MEQEEAKRTGTGKTVEGNEKQCPRVCKPGDEEEAGNGRVSR
jgi:hypothetical protein